MNPIDKIRKQNETFVQNRNFKGVKKLVVDNYNDSAHFVYELLQNADDAKATEIEFTLYDEELSVTHNGVDFTSEDVNSICSISMGTKGEDYTKIGRFGIGFKSVFVYTMNPQIHSGDFDFEIEDLILPKNIKKINHELGTVFNFPLNNNKNAHIAYSQIETKFSEMCEEAIMFLKNLKSIKLRSKNLYKVIEKKTDKKEMLINNSVSEYITINISSNEYGENDRMEYSFIMMTKNDISLNDYDSEGNRISVSGQSVKIAYPLDEDNNITEPDELGLNDNYYVFFPTMIRNDYPFLIHAPFITKFSRDTFSQTSEANIILKKALGTLIADSIIILAGKQLIDEDSIENMFFSIESDQVIYNQFIEEYKTLIKSNKRIIPTHNGNFTSYNNALFTKEDKETSELIIKLLGKRWLAQHFNCSEKFEICNITNNGYYGIKYHQFLIDEFNPKILSKDYLLEHLSNDYLSNKDNGWFKNYISLFIKKYNYWYSDHANYAVEDDLDLRKYPLLRLNDHSHINYVQSKTDKDIYLNNKSIEEELLKDELVFYLYKEIYELKNFSSSLSSARDAISTIIKHEWTEEKYPMLLKSIIEAVKSKELDLKEIENKQIILIRNLKTGKIALEKPRKVKIGKIKGTDIDLHKLYRELDEFLIDKNIQKAFSIEDLELLGCQSSFETERIGVYRLLSIINDISIHSYYSNARAEYVRSLSSGFEPLNSYPILEKVFNNRISLDISIELMKAVRYLQNKIKGYVEYSSRQDFSSSAAVYGEQEVYSSLGLCVFSESWVYDKNNNLRRPMDLTVEELKEEYQKIITIDFAKKLGFKESENQKIKKFNEQLKKEGIKGKYISEEEYTEYEKWKEAKRKEQIRKEKKLNSAMSVTQGLSELNSSSVNTFEVNKEENVDDYNSIHDPKLREMRLREEFENNEKKKRKSHRISVKSYVNKDEKAFLNMEYQGHCQVCNEVIVDRHRKYIYSATNLIRTSKLKEDDRNSEHLAWNSLCLCPNCAAKFKYCDNNFEGFIDQVKYAEIEVDDNEEFYFDIQLAGEDRTLLYSPKHLQNLKVAIDYYENKDSDIEKILEEDINE